MAQTPNPQKAEADRLRQQGREQYQTSQFEAALQSWQRTLTIYREIKDRFGEGACLGNLGLVYLSLGDYAKAIEYQQKRLAIAREIKDRFGEGQSLGNLGVAYYSLNKKLTNQNSIFGSLSPQVKWPFAHPISNLCGSVR